MTVQKDNAAEKPATITVKYPYGTIRILVEAPKGTPEGAAFLERNGRVVMDAAHFTAKHDTENARLYVVPELGRKEDGVALYPLTARFAKAEEAPYVEYSFVTEQDGEYDLHFQMLPTNSYLHRVPVKLCYALDDQAADTLTSIPITHVPGASWDWGMGVMNHTNLVSTKCTLKAGRHTLRLYGTDPENVAERIHLIREGSKWDTSYLGPDESMKCE